MDLIKQCFCSRNGLEVGEKVPVSFLKRELETLLGEKWFEFEQDEIFLSLEEDGVFRNKSFDYDLMSNKINALKTYLMVDSFYFDIDIFQKIVLAINEEVVIANLFQDVDLSDIMYCFSELGKNFGLDSESFNIDIKAYVASIAKEDGFFVLPKIINFCQPQLDKLSGDNNIDSLKRMVYDKIESDISSLDQDSVTDQQVLKLKRLRSKFHTKHLEEE